MTINTITSWEFNNVSFPNSNTQIYQVVDMAPPNTFTYQSGWVATSGTRLADAPASPAAAPVCIDLVSKVFSGSSSANLCAAVRATLGITDASVVSPKYLFALRATQSGFGVVIDQSQNASSPIVNPVLWPSGWIANTAYTVGNYRSPSVLNGFTYKCTTAGTSGATQPTWPTTLGATVSDGTAVWTCSKGPWTVNNSLKTFRTVSTADLGSGVGNLAIPGIGSVWDLANGDSLIFHVKINGAAFSGGAAKSIFSCFGSTTDNTGWSLQATGTPFFDLRLYVRDKSGNFVQSGDLSGTDATLAAQGVNRPMDGGTRSVTLFIDGLLKRSYFYVDGVPVPQAAMADASNLTPHDFSLAAVTGSTSTTNGQLSFGTHYDGAASYELGVTQADYLVLKSQSLPANLAPIASWFRDRSALLPASLVI